MNCSALATYRNFFAELQDLAKEIEHCNVEEPLKTLAQSIKVARRETITELDFIKFCHELHVKFRDDSYNDCKQRVTQIFLTKKGVLQPVGIPPRDSCTPRVQVLPFVILGTTHPNWELSQWRQALKLEVFIQRHRRDMLMKQINTHGNHPNECGECRENSKSLNSLKKGPFDAQYCEKLTHYLAMENRWGLRVALGGVAAASTVISGIRSLDFTGAVSPVVTIEAGLVAGAAGAGIVAAQRLQEPLFTNTAYHPTLQLEFSHLCPGVEYSFSSISSGIGGIVSRRAFSTVGYIRIHLGHEDNFFYCPFNLKDSVPIKVPDLIRLREAMVSALDTGKLQPTDCYKILVDLKTCKLKGSVEVTLLTQLSWGCLFDLANLCRIQPNNWNATCYSSPLDKDWIKL